MKNYTTVIFVLYFFIFLIIVLFNFSVVVSQ
jgi:hypothetical protein